MLTYPKSTMRVRRIPMHLSSSHVTLMPGKFYPPPIFPQSDLGRRADSRWALPQISSFFSYGPRCIVYLFTSDEVTRTLSVSSHWSFAGRPYCSVHVVIKVVCFIEPRFTGVVVVCCRSRHPILTSWLTTDLLRHRRARVWLKLVRESSIKQLLRRKAKVVSSYLMKLAS